MAKVVQVRNLKMVAREKVSGSGDVSDIVVVKFERRWTIYYAGDEIGLPPQKAADVVIGKMAHLVDPVDDDAAPVVLAPPAPLDEKPLKGVIDSAQALESEQAIAEEAAEAPPSRRKSSRLFGGG